MADMRTHHPKKPLRPKKRATQVVREAHGPAHCNAGSLDLAPESERPAPPANGVTPTRTRS